MRRAPLLLAAVLLTALAAAPPAGAAGATRSANVTRVATLAEPGAVSARARGAHLFLSTVSGLSVYDVRDPRAPVRVGRLNLRVAQNEDVDVGGDILLMTDEPGAGAGVLHVVDVRDPTRPTVLSTYSTWARGLLDEFLGLGRRRPRRGGIGHTATCIQDCRYAYLAGSPAGIEIVDLRDPRRPRFAGRFAARAASYGLGSHDVQIDARGLAWVAGGGGTAAYDIRDPLRPRLVRRTDRSARGPDIESLLFGTFGSGRRRNDLIHHNSVRVGNTVAITEEDLYRPRCAGAGTLQTWAIGRGQTLRPLDSWRVEREPASVLACSAHYHDVRDGIVAQGWFEQGVRFVDMRNPRRLRQVGYWVPRGGMFWGAVYPPTDPSGRTVYAIDHRRGVDVLAFDRARLATVRRRAPRRRPSALNASLFVDDGRDDVRPGSVVTAQVVVSAEGARTARNLVAVLRLPPQVATARVLGRGRYEPRRRRVVFGFGRLRQDSVRRRVRLRLRRDAPAGPLLLEARVRVRGDAMPLDDRFVDRDRIGARTTRSRAAAAGARPRTAFFCRLGAPYGA